MLKLKALIFLLVTILEETIATGAEKLCHLEKNVDDLEPLDTDSLEGEIELLESRMEQLETLCVAGAGMKRHCLSPKVLNGWAKCPSELKPGRRCFVECNTGYIATLGKDLATCQRDGFWDNDLECDIPVVVLSGGIVNDSNSGDDSVEVISLYPSQGCNVIIPNMPKADGSHRTLHNLIYIPHRKILACNKKL